MPISRKHYKPVTSDEMNTIKSLLGVSDKRISQKQKQCIIHLISQYEILDCDRKNRELEDMLGLEEVVH